MTHRERFHAVFNYQSFDRLPVYFFGTWPETKTRWAKEGLTGIVHRGGSGGPQLPEMDPDWEGCIWTNQDLITPAPLSEEPTRVVEETDQYRVVRTPLGGVVKESTGGSSIAQHLQPDLKPTRKDWERFRRFLDSHDPARWLPGWEEKTDELNARDGVSCFFGGSLFGRMREWMTLENISFLPVDDPLLYEEMVEYMADFYMAVAEPILERVNFDFAYFFEDCCCRSGPLVSPRVYQEVLDKHYRRMIEFYRDMGVPLMLIDSDGKVDDLLPLWLDTGFDIIFPIEIGTWGADPLAMRKTYGRRLRMLGGVDKHVIPRGESAIYEHLARLRDVVEDGGCIPIPDHRIPPDCSLEQFRTYLRVFKQLFCKPDTVAG